jgi:phosphatidylcholine synthase
LTPLPQIRAFSVHVLTALGAAFALAALMAATLHRWDVMFACLGTALLVDGIDGTIARRLKVKELLPRWSGDVLDLVVDFVTYVFVPAYAIATGLAMPQWLGLAAGAVIVVTGALYFADRDMKTEDNYFRGFPTLWNAAAFYLFLLQPAPWLSAAIVGALAVLTFVPFKFVHPFRVARLRSVTIAMVGVWSALAALALLHNFDPGPWVTGGLVATCVYFVALGLTDRTPIASSSAHH